MHKRKHKTKPEEGKGNLEIYLTAGEYVPAGIVGINNSTKHYSNYYTLQNHNSALSHNSYQPP